MEFATSYKLEHFQGVMISQLLSDEAILRKLQPILPFPGLFHLIHNKILELPTFVPVNIKDTFLFLLNSGFNVLQVRKYLLK